MINLVVELDERYTSDVAARERIARAGYNISVSKGASDPVLAWLDEIFGGAWSSEVAVADVALATLEGKPAGFAAFDPRGLRFAWLRGLAREPDVGVFGPFGVAPALRGSLTGAPQGDSGGSLTGAPQGDKSGSLTGAAEGDTLGSNLLHIALCGLRARGYRRGLIAATSEGLVPYYERHTGARVVERYDPSSFTLTPIRTVVLASGNGGNFQAVIDRVADGLPLNLVALVSNRSNAFAIDRARGAGIPAAVVTWERERNSRTEYDRMLRDVVASYEPELILLLGWMHLLEPAFVDAFPEMLNIHPAFLPLDPSRNSVGMPDGAVIPAFRGAHAVRDALTANSQWVGASVHEVTTDTDRGRVLARKPMRIIAGEEEGRVLARLHPIEHHLVAIAIRRWLFERE